MAKKKQARRVTKRTQYRFVIDAYTPETLPMSRLAEYLTEFANLLGEAKSVHFEAIEEGSAVPVAWAEHEAVPKIRDRVANANRDEGDPTALQAKRKLNQLLRLDNATGRLIENRARRPLLIFPGKNQQVARAITTHRPGTIDGKLVNLGGTDETIHATLLSDGKRISGIEMNELVALQLRHRLFNFVRLMGEGAWERGSDGQWSLRSFKVHNSLQLDTAPLSETLKQIRAIGTGWSDETAFDELTDLRHGPESDAGD